MSESFFVSINQAVPSVNSYLNPVVVNNKVAFFQTQETKKFVANLRGIFVEKYKKAQPLSGPVRVRMTVRVKNKLSDLDNHFKVPLDALAGLAYANDKEIYEIQAKKLVTAEAGVDIEIEKIIDKV